MGRKTKRNARKDKEGKGYGKEGKRDKVPYQHFLYQLTALATVYIQLLFYQLFYTDANTYTLSQLTTSHYSVLNAPPMHFVKHYTNLEISDMQMLQANAILTISHVV